MLTKILATADRGSVITKDHAVKTLSAPLDDIKKDSKRKRVENVIRKYT